MKKRIFLALCCAAFGVFLACSALFLFVLYVLHVVRSFIQGLGDTLLPMVSGLAEFFVRTGAALLLPRFFGQEGLYFAEASAWMGADVILIISYFIKMRQLKKYENVSG